jgi:hypothetical protein
MQSKHLKLLLLFAAIIILSFLHNFKALHKGIQRYQHQAPDQITVYEKRFSALKAFLQNQPVVGYVSDYGDNSKAGGLAYRMAQYVLAPTILVRGVNRDFIIGNFQTTHPNIKAFEKDNLSLHMDFGNGVILFERMGN